MRLAPEAAAFIGKPPAAPPHGRAVRGYAGSINEQPNQHTKEGETMPTGVYPRKKRAAKPVDKPVKPDAEAQRKATVTKAAKPKPNGNANRRFGVWDDGTVELSLPKCAGTIAAEDARQLVDFIARLGR